ncbi:hypothetical protein [Serratia proteamaculans]
MEVMNLIITIFQEAPIPAKIAYVTGIGTGTICLVVFIAKAILFTHAWILEK